MPTPRLAPKERARIWGTDLPDATRRIDVELFSRSLFNEGYKSETVQAKCIYSAKVTEITLVAPQVRQ